MAVPSHAASLFVARLDCLASIREISRSALAIGREFSFDLLAVVTGLNRRALTGALRGFADAEPALYARGRARDDLHPKHALVQNAPIRHWCATNGA
jgi:hypothetical protein